MPATKWREVTAVTSSGDRGLQREVAGSGGIEAPLLELLSACTRMRARGGWASGGWIGARGAARREAASWLDDEIEGWSWMDREELGSGNKEGMDPEIDRDRVAMMGLD